MQSNLSKNLEKINKALHKLSKPTKIAIKYGTILCLALLVVGSVLIWKNRGLNYDSGFEYIATSLVKNSFIILAEIIIGSLLVDYVFSTRE